MGYSKSSFFQCSVVARGQHVEHVTSCFIVTQNGNFMYVNIFKYILHKIIIRKTCPYNVYPLEPHFYIAKLGYAGVYLFFLFLLQNIDCGYSLEPPRRGGSNV